MKRKILMLKVGEREIPPINHLYLEENAPSRLLTCMYFWCIQEGGSAILVDQGFSAQTLKDLKIQFRLEAEPPELLRRAGIDPHQVNAVILTHLHWDHYAGEDFFPNAHYYLQRKEMEFLASPLIRCRALGRFYSPAAVQNIGQLHLAGRVRFVDGDEEIFPGIATLWTGGHSPGSQGIVLETPSGKAIVCGDVVPRYQNIRENIPCGIHTSAIEAVEALEKIREKAGSLDLILTGHDPEAMQKFRKLDEGVFRVAG